MKPSQPKELLAALDAFLEAAGTAAIARRQAKYVRRYRRLIVARFRAQKAWFLKHALPHLKHGRLGESLREAASDDDIADTTAALIDSWFDDPDIVRDLQQLHKEALEAGADAVKGILTSEQFSSALAKLVAKRGLAGYQFALDNPRALQYLKDSAFDLAGASLDATTRIVIKDILLDAMENHLGYDAIAKAIREKFDDWTKQRATTIATFEMGTAYTQGTLAAGEDLQVAGLEMQKAWLTAGDDLVDEECAANEDAGWIDLDDTFPSGDEAPLQHPNCRCALQMQMVPAAELAAA